MRTIIAGLILVFAGLQYKLWFGDGGVTQWIKLESTRALKEQEIEQLTARNEGIESEILELKSGDNALEEQARSDLGMIKRGETYYHFAN